MRLSIEQLEPRLALHGEVHSDNAEMHAEHDYLFALFPEAAADGVNRIVVPDGEVLIVNDVLEADWILVQGTLAIQDGAEILVDTIVTDPGSLLAVTGGTVTFRDGPLRTDDPLQMSRGLIAHGEVYIEGSNKTPFADLVDTVYAGASTLNVEPVLGWEVGDRIVIPGASKTANQDDERTITSYNCNQITLDAPLTYDHTTLLGHKPVVANLTRSVVFESENPDGVRGHVMMMHNASRVDIEYAAFENLGRTKADVVVTDPLIDGSNGDNARGRYSLHFHRGGVAGDYGHVSGVVVSGAKKLGIVNHSSAVIVDQSITYKFGGSGFFTETGEEVGEFNDNLAIRSTGTLFDGPHFETILTPRREAQDFGFTEVGFWLQGQQVSLSGNAAYGVNTGVGMLVEPLVENGQTVTIVNTPVTIDHQLVVGAEFGIFFNHLGSVLSPIGGPQEISYADLINVGTATSFSYSAGVHVSHTRAVGNVAYPRNIAFTGNGAEDDIWYSDTSAEGFLVGIRPSYIDGFIDGDWDYKLERVHLTNIVGVGLICTCVPLATGTYTELIDVTFGDLPLESLRGTGSYEWPYLLPAGQQWDILTDLEF